MAAILCKGCVDCCNGFFTGCSKCSFNCCKGCGTACESICKVLTYPCEIIWKVCTNSGPFCLYVTVALGLNLPPIIIGIATIPTTYDCGNRSILWLLVNILLCFMNMAAAVYLTNAIYHNDQTYTDSNITGNNSGNNNNNSVGTNFINSRSPPPPPDATTFAKATYLLCYDKWMASYILGLIAYFVWIIVGVMWLVSGDMSTSGSSVAQCKETSPVNMSLGFDAAFLVFGFGALLCSLCLSCFHTHNSGPPSGAQQQQQQQQQPTQAQRPPQPVPGVPTVVATASIPATTGFKQSNVEVPYATATAIPDPIPPPSAPTKDEIKRI